MVPEEQERVSAEENRMVRSVMGKQRVLDAAPGDMVISEGSSSLLNDYKRNYGMAKALSEGLHIGKMLMPTALILE